MSPVKTRWRGVARLGVFLSVGLSVQGGSLVATAQRTQSESPADRRGKTPEANSKQAESDSKEKKSTSSEDMTEVYSGTDARKGVGTLARDFLGDQKGIWTSPARADFSDIQWFLPLGSLAGGMFATDYEFSRRLSINPSTISRYKNISDAGVGALIGGAGGMWVLGHFKHNEHWSETGFLAGEAAVNSLVAVEALKYSLRRERPYQGDGTGPFFQSGGTSFPSEHSAAAWAIAGVIAHEYPGPLTKFGAYGLAALVSFSRVKARQHFTSDVYVGGLLGNMIAQDVYVRHADHELGGSSWQSIPEFLKDHSELAPLSMGTTYVPLDSWVYPAFERLEAMGYVNTAFEGVKPWPRTDCARLIEEAREAVDASDSEGTSSGEQARSMINVLAKEFSRELGLETGDANEYVQLNSVYTRVLSASGPVLTDGYHFGQTYGYDFGRPFRRGTNLIAGSSGMFTYGRLFFYVSGEYQQSPSAPELSLVQRQFIANRDETGLPAAQPFDPIHKFTLLDTYMGMNLDNWQIVFGKQSLSWGPGVGGSLILSDNAEPMYMARLTQVQPFKLPFVLSILGPARFESFLGTEQGHPLSGQPFVYGQKISLKPFSNFEWSFSRETTIGGFGDPLNTKTFFTSFFGRVYFPPGQTTGSVPGDSHTDIDWTWRIPGLGDRLVFYGELEDDDDPIPLQNLTKNVYRPGFYLPRLPWLTKWDFHVEYTSSETPGRKSYQGQGRLNYWNQNYLDGYTNEGNLIGNIVGREGRNFQAWTRHWISPTNTLDLTCKLNIVDNDFIPGGAKWQDYRVDYERHFHSGAYVRSTAQFEHISHYPLLFTRSQNNVLASLEIGFQPWAAH
jgi:membrane-associated phospholipid phosphatase